MPCSLSVRLYFLRFQNIQRVAVVERKSSLQKILTHKMKLFFITSQEEEILKLKIDPKKSTGQTQMQLTRKHGHGQLWVQLSQLLGQMHLRSAVGVGQQGSIHVSFIACACNRNVGSVRIRVIRISSAEEMEGLPSN